MTRPLMHRPRYWTPLPKERTCCYSWEGERHTAISCGGTYHRSDFKYTCTRTNLPDMICSCQWCVALQRDLKIIDMGPIYPLADTMKERVRVRSIQPITFRDTKCGCEQCEYARFIGHPERVSS